MVIVDHLHSMGSVAKVIQYKRMTSSRAYAEELDTTDPLSHFRQRFLSPMA
jgi:hypothetical protein